MKSIQVFVAVAILAVIGQVQATPVLRGLDETNDSAVEAVRRVPDAETCRRYPQYCIGGKPRPIVGNGQEAQPVAVPEGEEGPNARALDPTCIRYPQFCGHGGGKPPAIASNDHEAQPVAAEENANESVDARAVNPICIRYPQYCIGGKPRPITSEDQPKSA